MEIKEFGRIMAREVKDALGEDYEVGCNEIVKNNGVIRHALVIRKEGEFVSPTIYLGEFYQQFCDGVMLMSLVDEVIKMYRRSIVPAAGLEMDFFRDFSEVTERLCYKLVNYERNKESLKDIPFRKVMDLAMVPLCRVENDIIGSGNITVTNTHLNMWEISEEELWENIKENAPKLAPVKIQGLPEVLQKITGCDDDLFSICGIRVVSNTADCLGAGAVFYPGVLRELSEEFEEDLFIVPSSIHEVLVFPVHGLEVDISELRKIIHEVNTTTVRDEEILSDHLYLYDSERDTVYVLNDDEEQLGA